MPHVRVALGELLGHPRVFPLKDQQRPVDRVGIGPPQHEFAPGLDKITLESPAPLLANADGKYPVPMPGITKKREY